MGFRVETQIHQLRKQKSTKLQGKTKVLIGLRGGPYVSNLEAGRLFRIPE